MYDVRSYFAWNLVLLPAVPVIVVAIVLDLVFSKFQLFNNSYYGYMDTWTRSRSFTSHFGHLIYQSDLLTLAVRLRMRMHLSIGCIWPLCDGKLCVIYISCTLSEYYWAMALAIHIKLNFNAHLQIGKEAHGKSHVWANLINNRAHWSTEPARVAFKTTA